MRLLHALEYQVTTWLVEGSVFVVELNLFHFETATPLGLISQAVLKRTLGVLLANEELYRVRVVKLG